MTPFIDTWLTPGLALLADWSLRWGVAIGLLAGLFLLRPPRRTGTRALLAHVTLWGGLALPLAPGWGPTVVRMTAESSVATSRETPIGRPAVVADSETIPTIKAALPIHESLIGSEVSNVAERGADHPAQISREQLGWQRWLILAFASIWLAGVTAMIARLLIGWRWLARLRSEARPVGSAALALLAKCRAELRVRRNADLRTHSAVGSPVLVGGRRPVVLVPVGWEDLPDDARRVSLLHELAHLARRDDWGRFGQECVRVVFFFHPLVHWLLARLDCEREQLCDEAVVRGGVAPRVVAGVLFDFARGVVGRPATFALPLFRRSTVRDRIEHLMEEDVMRWFTPLSRTQTLVLGAVALGGLLGLGGFAVRAGTAVDAPQPKAESPPDRPQATDLIEIRGTLLNPDGQPVGGATIAPGMWFRAPLPTADTDSEGRFAIFVPFHKLNANTSETRLIVGKTGFAHFAVGIITPMPANDFVVIHQPKWRSYAGTVKDREGRAVVGASVQLSLRREPPVPDPLTRVVFPVPDQLLLMHARAMAQAGVAKTLLSAAFIDDLKPNDALIDMPIDTALRATTDDRGQFLLPHIPENFRVAVDVTARGMADYLMPGNSSVEMDGTVARPTVITLDPEAVIRGQVVSHVPGLGAGGRTVSVSRTGGNNSEAKIVTADAQGRFTLSGLWTGPAVVWVSDSAGDSEVLTRNGELQIEARRITTIDLAIRGMAVEGRVLRDDANSPLPGAIIEVIGASRRFGMFRRKVTADNDGVYRFSAPVGGADLTVVGGSGFTTNDAPNVRIPDGATTFRVPDVHMTRW